MWKVEHSPADPRCNSPALTPFLCGSSLLDQFFLEHTRNNLTPPFPLSKTLWFIHKVSSTGVCGCVCGGWTAPSTDRICHSNQQAEAKYHLHMFGVIMLLLKVLISQTERRGWTGYLTLAAQSRLLQSWPDALDASGVFGVDVTVSTHALVFLHQGVVHQTCKDTNEYLKRAAH